MQVHLLDLFVGPGRHIGGRRSTYRKSWQTGMTVVTSTAPPTAAAP